MARVYARSGPNKPFHIVEFDKAICTAPLSKRAQFTKELRKDERLCKNCAILRGLAQQHPHSVAFLETQYMDEHLRAIQRER